MASAFHILQAAERLEMLASGLYRLLADRFAHDPPAHELFLRLADEEVQHAARVRLLAAQYRNDRRMFDEAIRLAGTTLQDPEAAVAAASALVEEVASGAWGDDLATVKDRLVDLEESCASFHAQFLARGVHPEVARFFDELASQDREHQRLLAALR